MCMCVCLYENEREAWGAGTAKIWKHFQMECIEIFVDSERQCNETILKVGTAFDRCWKLSAETGSWFETKCGGQGRRLAANSSLWWLAAAKVVSLNQQQTEAINSVWKNKAGGETTFVRKGMMGMYEKWTAEILKFVANHRMRDIQKKANNKKKE